MTDLTKITEPFGLLDWETQTRLYKAMDSGQMTQLYTASGWVDRNYSKNFYIEHVYRLKPEPETVTVYGCFSPNGGYWSFGARCQNDTHSITLTLDENGGLDCSKPAKVEKL